MPDRRAPLVVDATSLDHPLASLFRKRRPRTDLRDVRDTLLAHPGVVALVHFQGLPVDDMPPRVFLAGNAEDARAGNAAVADLLSTRLQSPEARRDLMQAWDICRLGLSLSTQQHRSWTAAINCDTCLFLPVPVAIRPDRFGDLKDGLLTPALTRSGFPSPAIFCAPAFGPHVSHHARLGWQGRFPSHAEAILAATGIDTPQEAKGAHPPCRFHALEEKA